MSKHSISILEMSCNLDCAISTFDGSRPIDDRFYAFSTFLTLSYLTYHELRSGQSEVFGSNCASSTGSLDSASGHIDSEERLLHTSDRPKLMGDMVNWRSAGVPSVWFVRGDPTAFGGGDIRAASWRRSSPGDFVAERVNLFAEGGRELKCRCLLLLSGVFAMKARDFVGVDPAPNSGVSTLSLKNMLGESAMLTGNGDRLWPITGETSAPVSLSKRRRAGLGETQLKFAGTFADGESNAGSGSMNWKRLRMLAAWCDMAVEVMRNGCFWTGNKNSALADAACDIDRGLLMIAASASIFFEDALVAERLLLAAFVFAFALDFAFVAAPFFFLFCSSLALALARCLAALSSFACSLSFCLRTKSGYSNLRFIEECQRFLIALSVRPCRSLAISAHLLPWIL